MKAKFFRTPSDVRTWLEKHHARSVELLVGFYKRESGKPSITSHESVGEALCFGWMQPAGSRVYEARRSNKSGVYPVSVPPPRGDLVGDQRDARRDSAAASPGPDRTVRAGKMDPTVRAQTEPALSYASAPASRRRAISTRGGAPNRRRYSRLNCEGLS